jgi:hypothetical protein
VALTLAHGTTAALIAARKRSPSTISVDGFVFALGQLENGLSGVNKS